MYKKVNPPFLSLQLILAGFVACLIGYSSSAIIVLNTAVKLGLSHEVASTWTGVLCVSMGLLSIFFSWRYKVPILFAWSTAGAAFLLSTIQCETIQEVYGAFIVSALLVFLTGVTGLFEKSMQKIPTSLAQGMLAGVLLKFVLQSFQVVSTNYFLFLSCFIIFIVGKKLFSKYVILLVIIFGFIVAEWQGLIPHNTINFHLSSPVFYAPTFNWQTIISLAIPLFLINSTSQNMSGVAALHAHHFSPPISPLLWGSGLANILIAPFGGFSINLAALTASLCMSEDAHPDKALRYYSAIYAGLFYVVMGLFSGTIGQFFESLPTSLILLISGFALFNTVVSGLQSAIKSDRERESSMIAFFVAASGLNFLGIGSAFWAIIFGGICFILHGLILAKK